MFLLSYLDNRGDICYEKKYDLLFKISSNYLYSKNLFNELGDAYPEINKKDNFFYNRF